MFKRVLAIIGLVSAGLAAWPAWADGTAVQRLGAGVPTAIAVSPDGTTLAVGTSVGVWFLSAATLAPLTFWDAGQWVQAVAYSADGRYLRADDRFYDTTTGTAALLVPADLAWQPPSGRPQATVREHDCSPDGRRCLVYNLDNLIIRDQATRIDAALLRTGLLFGAAWSPDGNTIYTVVYGGVQAWEAGSATLRQSQTEFFSRSLYGVTWSADSTRVAAGNHAWDLATGQPVERVECGAAHPPANCAGPRVQMPDPGAILVQDSPETTAWRLLEPHDSGTTAVALSADGTLLVTSGSDLAQFACPGPSGRQCQDVVGTTRIWDEQTFKRLGQLPVQFYSAALSPDGRLVLGQTADGIEVWDWSVGQQLWAKPEPIGETNQLYDSLWHYPDLSWSHDLAVSPDGRYAATYANQTSNTTVSLWRIATGEKAATLTGHTTPAPWPRGRLGNLYGIPWWRGVRIEGLAFSPDGRHLAASSLDGTVLVWPVP